MILEGFEIEHWSCIERMAVEDLPPAGVVVFHGPNGTGKSSAIEAVRACLMDKKSTSRALDRGFPKNSAERPRVSVTFRAGGTSWRITKQFSSKDSRLESRTPGGQWKLETADPSEAHDRARRLAGGSDSTLGLHQLLWLTQAEFRLPDPKRLDADVQSRLRAVLGVLQTPLDDRFLGRVKEEWSRWFSARNKPGERPKLKPGCPLDKDLILLGRYEGELAGVEAEYREFEQMIGRSSRLEVSARDLHRQLDEKTIFRDRLQREYAECRVRLEAHRHAAEEVGRSEAALGEARARKRRRADAEGRIRDAEAAAEEARGGVEEAGGRLRAAEEKLRGLRRDLQRSGIAGRELRQRLSGVSERRSRMELAERLVAVRDNLRRAERAEARVEELKKQVRERPAPDDATIKALEANRTDAARARAELDASTIDLTLLPDPGAAAAALLIDGTPAAGAGPTPDRGPIRHSIRRRAEIAVPGWGRVEVIRGADARSLDQIEDELGRLERQFAEWLAPFGIAPSDPTALDQLRGSAAEGKLRAPELKRRSEDLAQLAPDGLDALRGEADELGRRLQARDSDLGGEPLHASSPPDAGQLDGAIDDLKECIRDNEAEVAATEGAIEALELQIEGQAAARPAAHAGGGVGSGGRRTPAAGLREREAAAKERLTSLVARLAALRDDLGNSPPAERIEEGIRDADVALATARDEFDSSRLNEGELTVRDRLDAACEGCRALEGRRTAVDRELHELRGALGQSEGLHQRRAALAARVEELRRRTEREALESDAFDRLYALFEECRERQLGAIMGPIHDRVLRWMRLLRIGGYQRIHFNDQFLPETLIAGDGAIELSLAEESIGTVEQIALMVRLALGASLSTPEEPAVAVLDDPLTHSDVERLDLMRTVLKSAAAGDAGLTPPAGPLQILVFTCHPEWFAIDGARMIDLSKSEPMPRTR